MLENSVVIVEDDEITTLNLKLSLQKYGYNVISTCNNANDAKDKIKKLTPDIVIIDISLEESEDGIELGNVVRQKYRIPFIYLTSYSDNNIIAQAKLTQPYGYIVKPFNPSSLHATIQMAIFKYESENAKINLQDKEIKKLDIDRLLDAKKEVNKTIVYFGDNYHIDLKIGETFYKDKKIKLTKKENSFLRLLVARLTSVVSFDEAMNYVWYESGTSPNSVRTLVWRLRNKLPTKIIKNASGIGYCIEK